MKTNVAVAVSATILLAVTFASAQSDLIRARIPFEFTAAGKVLPAGEYDFVYNPQSKLVQVRGAAKEPSVLVNVVTTLAGAMHTTPADSHLVFDKVGNNHFLSEIWMPGIDGIQLASTKQTHEHAIVNVPR